MITKKLKSFTILEVVISMVITLIVIGVGYTGSTLVFKEFLIYKKNSESTADLSLFDRLLLNDVIRSKYVKKENDLVTCQYGLKKIKYEFSDDYCLRYDSILVDTFRFRFQKPQVLFHRAIVEEGIGDEIRIRLIHKEQEVQLIYRKKYSAETLMNYED